MVKAPKSVQVGLNLHFVTISGTWEPNDAERAAAWELYMELVTRVAVVPLPAGQGLLREALTSLYSLFASTRGILREAGPEIAEPKKSGEYNFGYLAVAMLNYALRPLLTRWHPALADWEAHRPADRSRGDHEQAWPAAAYPGGVFWLRAHGSDAIGTGWTAEQRHADRHAQLAALAAARGLPIDRSDPTQVLAALRHSIGADGRRCLWVVDDVPDQLDADELLDWVAPHPLAATMLTTRSRRYGALATPVDLDVLDPDDGYQLLTAHRLPTDPDEKDAARGLVADLGGHALALDIAGAALATGAGLQSIADYRAALQDPASDELELAAELADALPTGH
jgi:hypothetical protein